MLLLFSIVKYVKPKWKHPQHHCNILYLHRKSTNASNSFCSSRPTYPLTASLSLAKDIAVASLVCSVFDGTLCSHLVRRIVYIYNGEFPLGSNEMVWHAFRSLCIREWTESVRANIYDGRCWNHTSGRCHLLNGINVPFDHEHIWQSRPHPTQTYDGWAHFPYCYIAADNYYYVHAVWNV